ncbi:MAG TPA: O-antigen ligase family protein [Solirubrobacterales bacterium]|nr:O-antigen ligase family protein [Solirubrobacterales bacterium]
MTGVMTWWALEHGAFFPVDSLPGGMILLLLAATLLAFAPWPARLRGPALAALSALALLAGWILISALWSAAPDVAIEDAQRCLLYAVGFGLGLWLCLLLGRHMLLSLVPLAATAGLVAAATLFTLWTGDDLRELLGYDATLQFPLGYRNAAAAFFSASVWPTIVLAASSDLDWRLRGLFVGSATLCIELAVLAQSRASVFAVAAGLAVLVAVHPARLRILAWLGLAAAGAGIAVPWILDVYQQGGSGINAETASTLHRTCGAMAVTSVLSIAAGCVAARVGRSFELSARARTRTGWALVIALAASLLVAGFAFVSERGSPLDELERQADNLSAGSGELPVGESRFGLDLRTERGDHWRVAFDDFKAEPLVGEGAGGFRYSYLKDRESALQSEDPHSVELLMAGELGLPGLILFAVFVVGSVIAALCTRRLGPEGGALAAGALAAAAYWLVHASVDWFWSYPSLTFPAVFALGAAAAPSLGSSGDGSGLRIRRSLAPIFIALAVALVPFWLSDRYTNEALETWRADLSGAYADLGRAADLNPVSDRPLVAEAVIAEQAGDPQRALAALADAQARQPEEWTLYWIEARILAETDPARADAPLRMAQSLNPAAPELKRLARRLRAQH